MGLNKWGEKEPNQKEKGHVDTENILFPCMCKSALILYSFPMVFVSSYLHI